MKTCDLIGNGRLQSHKKSYELRLHSVSEEMQFSETKSEKAIEIQQPRLKCRYVVTFIGFWIYFIISFSRLNTSVSIVAMVNQSALDQHTKIQSDSCLNVLPNLTMESEKSSAYKEEGEFIWSPEIQGYIQGSYFLGHVIILAPAGRLLEIFGCKWFIFWNFLVTVACSFSVPFISRISSYMFIAVQFLKGVTQGLLQPAVSVLVANWFPKKERGLAFAVTLSGLSMGASIGSLLSGYLCSSLGKWPSSFYALGSLELMMSLLVLVFIHESPKDHPRISKVELDFILSGQENELNKKRPDAPWSQIFTSVPVYALMWARFGFMWMFYQFVIVQPTFLGTILHYPIVENGFFTALTFFIQFVFAQITITLSKLMIKKNVVSVDFTRKFWNFMACLGFSACTLGMYYAGCDRSLSVIFAVLSMAFTGFGYSGCLATLVDMTPTFAGTLNGISLSFSCLACVFIPLIVGYLTDGMQTIEQWNKVFFISIGVVMSSGILFAIFGSAAVQPWNYAEEEKDPKTGSETRF